MKIHNNLFGTNGQDKIHVDEIAMKQGNNPILLSGAVIVESGSNSNGNYVKFGDGTMICTHYMITNPIAISTAEGSMFTSPTINWTYPAKFVVNRPSISIGNNNTLNLAIGVARTIFTDALDFRMWRPVSDSAIQRHISLMAIGRWK